MSKRGIFAINLSDAGSTGSMMVSALEYAHQYGDMDYEFAVPCHSNNPHAFCYLGSINFISRTIRHFFFYKLKIIPDGLLTRAYSKKILHKLDAFRKSRPSTIVHLHNVHDSEIHFPFLLKGLRRRKIPVIMTLHDCWAFTGRCCYYGTIPCHNWQNGCRHCPLKLPFSHYALARKSKALHQLEKLLLLPCSRWLSNELGQSSLFDLPREVIQGETAMAILPKDDCLKATLGIPKTNRVVISVAAYWNEWKGIKFIYEMARKLPKNYTVLLVGGEPSTDGYDNIVSAGHVDNQRLSLYLQIADCFVSTTQCDNLPLVLMEAQLCGIPIVGFGHGGTPEEITSKSGIMVGTDNNVDKLVAEIVRAVEEKPYRKEDIIASGRRFQKGEYAKRMFPIYEYFFKEQDKTTLVTSEKN